MMAFVKDSPRNLRFGQNWVATAEIYMIWTNVARTNVAWTNVIMTVEMCSRWSQEPTFKVWSKSGE